MGTVAEVIDSRAFSEFCGVDSSNQVPDGDTLGRFQNFLIEHDLQQQFFSQIVCALTERGLILKKGTIVDSTIIATPSSTKTRYRGLRKQTAKLNMMFAIANLILADRLCLAA